MEKCSVVQKVKKHTDHANLSFRTDSDTHAFPFEHILIVVKTTRSVSLFFKIVISKQFYRNYVTNRLCVL